MKRLWFLAPLAIAAAAWMWIGISSFILLSYTDKLIDLVFPFNQVVIATFAILAHGIHSLKDFHTAAGILIGYGAATLLYVFLISLVARATGRNQRQPALYGKVEFADRAAMANNGLKTSRKSIGSE